MPYVHESTNPAEEEQLAAYADLCEQERDNKRNYAEGLIDKEEYRELEAYIAADKRSLFGG